jgi:ammonium transporter, Amt family
MTLPGLALFYGGLARSGSVLSILAQCLFSAAIMTILWTLFGYSMTFSDAGMKEGTINVRSFVGNPFDRMLMKGVSTGIVGTIPESLWFTFQLTFAIITPALITGAFAERMKVRTIQQQQQQRRRRRRRLL